MNSTAWGWITPDWPAPPGVVALVTTKGIGEGDYGGFNLALTVDDDPVRVQANRRELKQRLGVDAIQWLRQVHGSTVLPVSGLQQPEPAADGLYTRTPGLALAVLTADCLPVLFCNEEGSEVAVAHAGWRGLAAGILNRTLERFGQAPAALIAWLGPAIGQTQFEVGEEVRAAFLESPAFRNVPGVAGAFRDSGRAGHYHCDLYRLARLNLQAAGLRRIHGGDYCTLSDSERFYSYRRRPVCGRMASLIALQKP